jgi:hypothetical protein
MKASTTQRAGEISVTWGRADLNGASFARYTVSWQAKGGKWQKEVDPVLLWRHTITKLSKGVTYSVRVTVTTDEGSAAVTKLGILVAK